MKEFGGILLLAVTAAAFTTAPLTTITTHPSTCPARSIFSNNKCPAPPIITTTTTSLFESNWNMDNMRKAFANLFGSSSSSSGSSSTSKKIKDSNQITDESLSSQSPLQSKQQENQPMEENQTGKIIRCAAKSYDKEASKPSSRQYTTRKNELPLLHVTPNGVTGDYNHYRSIALKGTPNRAISILSTDAIHSIQSNELYSTIQPGDLGENILIEGLPYNYFKIGGLYQLGEKLLVEITERIEPCANLCKLSFINDASLAPKEKMQKCMGFLESLDDVDGKRGWYAKIIGDGGVVKVGDEVRPAMAMAIA